MTAFFDWLDPAWLGPSPKPVVDGVKHITQPGNRLLALCGKQLPMVWHREQERVVGNCGTCIEEAHILNPAVRP